MGLDVADHPRGQAVRASADRARRALSPGGLVAAALGLLGVAGWLVWTRGAQVGLRFVEFDSPGSLAAQGFWPASAASSRPAVFLYGFGYALALTGYTLPLYVSITVLPLTSGFSGAALLTFLAFTAAMAILMLVTTLLVAAFQQSTARIKRAGAIGGKLCSVDRVRA